MRWIMLAALVATVGCYRAQDGSLGLAPDDEVDTGAGGDTDSETESDATTDSDTGWEFDCGRACDAEAVCGADFSPYAGWDACFDGCEEALATEMTPEQEDAVECVWFECVLGAEAGEVPCDEWVDCIHFCTQWLFG
jgi:hypothetical protein